MKLIKRDAGRASERLCNREIKFLYIFLKPHNTSLHNVRPSSYDYPEGRLASA